MELTKHDIDVGPAMQDDSEFVSLVTSAITKRPEASTLHSQAETRSESFIWWIKILISSISAVAVVLVLLKWGVPFLFEKVCSAPFSGVCSALSCFVV